MPHENDVVQIYYDLRGASIALDAATYFAAAVGTLRLQGYRNFDVNIVAGKYHESSNREKAYTPDQIEWCLNNIILRLPLLIPGVLNVYVARSMRVLLADPRYPEGYGTTKVSLPYALSDVVNAAKKGADVQVYTASPYARTWAYSRLGPGKTIVMTIRGNDYSQVRDTPLDKWYGFYKHLCNAGYRVFVIPDQYDVLFQRQFAQYDWSTIPEAAIDLDMRLALHQECHTNIAWGSGSGMLLWYSKTRFLMFGVLNSDSNVTDPQYFNSGGIEVGQQHSFFSRDQHIDWTEASAVTTSYLIERTNAFLSLQDRLR